MKARETLRAALGICRRQLPALLLTAGLLLLPVTAIQLLAGYGGDWPVSWLGRSEGPVEGLAASPWKTAGDIVVGMFALLVQLLSFGAVTMFIASELAGRPVDWRSAWRLGLARARPLLTSSLAMVVPVFGFLFLFMIPAAVFAAAMAVEISHLAGLPRVLFWLLAIPGFLFVSVRVVFVTVVAMVEGLGGFAAYRRNLRLLEGRFWAIAAVVVPIEGLRHLLRALLDVSVGSAPLKDALTSGVTWLLMPLEIAVVLLLYMQVRTAREAPVGYAGAQLAADLDHPPGARLSVD